MNRIKDLPEDVVQHIMSYGYKEHKEYMKDICVKLDRSRILNQNIEIIEYEYQFCGTSYQEMLINTDKFILLKLFRQCIRCNCCTRHCHKRPKYLDNTLTYTENYNDGCTCKCRQLARFICKTFPHSYKGGCSHLSINYLFIDQES